MTVEEVKRLFIEELYRVCDERNDYIKQVNEVEYRTRCPFCGDSVKNFNTGHLYIRVDPTDNLPMVYNCFKCPEQGVINKEFLSIMGMDNMNLQNAVSEMNRNADDIVGKHFLYDNSIIYFDYEVPDIVLSNKTEYIEKRLGISFSKDEFMKMKVIPSISEFLLYNDINEFLMPSQFFQILEECYVGFLTFGSSYILFRDVTEKCQYPWIKYPITKKSKQSKCFYSIQNDIDVLTTEPFIINMAEGVFDILSVYGNLKYNKPNTLNIAVGGKQYLSILNNLVDMGIIGSNITINIFSDNDAEFNDTSNNQPTTIEYFKRVLNIVKDLYGDTNIFYNTIYKDIGVPKEKICLRRTKM